MRRLKKYKKMCTRKKELENIENDGRGENDRLSLLPDNLLISILSFIPFSSAVATSVLSHRWRHLWTYLTHISFNFSWSYEDSLHKFQNSITTINHVISKLTSHKIHTFHLHLPSYRAEEQVCSTLLVPMVDEICLRNPEDVEVLIPEYHGGDVNDYHSRMLALFQGISCTRSLTFRQCFHNHLLDASMPSFPNLVELSFDGWDLDSRSCMPSCLLSNVKIVEIFDMKPNDCGIRVLRDILSNATVLEQLQVSHVDYHGDEPLQDRLWDEYEFAMKLFELPRSSSSCQINLSGEMITVSSKDYRDGQLNCKLPNRIT